VNDQSIPPDLQWMLRPDAPHPADHRERMRKKLARLIEVAREDLMDPDTRFIDTLQSIIYNFALQSILYNFDESNRKAVAEGLGLSDVELLTLLAGFVLGHEMGWQDGFNRGKEER